MGAKTRMAIMSFHTTNDALTFKAAAEKAGFIGRLAPIPRQLSAGCGMAWREPMETPIEVHVGDIAIGGATDQAASNLSATAQTISGTSNSSGTSSVSVTAQAVSAIPSISAIPDLSDGSASGIKCALDALAATHNIDYEQLVELEL